MSKTLNVVLPDEAHKRLLKKQELGLNNTVAPQKGKKGARNKSKNTHKTAKPPQKTLRTAFFE